MRKLCFKAPLNEDLIKISFSNQYYMNKLRTRKILLQIEFHFNASSLIFNSFQFDRKYQNNHRKRQAIPNGLNASAKATSFVYAVVNHSFGSCPGVGNLLSWQKTNPGTEIHYVTSKHCHRHNGPEGWVHITSYYTNLNQTISES